MNKIKILKFLIGVFSVLILIFGIFWIYLLFFGGRQIGGITIIIEEFVAQSSVLVAGLCVSVTLLLMKIFSSRRKKHPKQFYAIIIIGLTISGLNLMSFFATPYTIVNAESEFDEVFGSNWEDNIPNDVKKHFLQMPYLLSSHFLTIPQNSVNIDKDVLFYTGENITLYFDAYTPTTSATELPGNGSIIINLHPGAWMSGGKGTWNMISTSKYLAAQGYIVFDIEYGLINWFEYVAEAPDTPEYLKGNFTIEDQIHHIGIFVNKCVDEYAATYGGDIKSVYYMGRSAGAHLAGVAGLGYNYDYHNTTFNSNIEIKGVMPLYTPSAAPAPLLRVNRTEDPEIYNAYNLSHISDPADPHVILFQGTSDSQVEIEGVLSLETKMENKSVKCCLITFPFAGHAQDFVLSTNIGQVWMYYLERFLYLTQ